MRFLPTFCTVASIVNSCRRRNSYKLGNTLIDDYMISQIQYNIALGEQFIEFGIISKIIRVNTILERVLQNFIKVLNKL
jgi:hypothetical protein